MTDIDDRAPGRELGTVWTREVRARLSPLRLSAAREAEIVDELSQHLDDRYRELIAGGAAPDVAARSTLAEFRSGNVLAQHMAPLRQSHAAPAIAPGAPTGQVLRDVWQDLRYAARTFRRQPGFAATAVLTLALGLGSATAIFGWVDRTFLQPLPVPEPDRLFNLGARSESGRVNMAFSYPEYLDYRRFDDAFAGLVAFDPGPTVVMDFGNGAERARVALVSDNFFSVLGVRPILGRTFDAKEDEGSSSHSVAVLSYTAWQRHFSGSPAVVGRTARLNGHVFTIIGVAPKAFTGIARGSFPSLYVPVTTLGEVRPSWTARPLTDRNHAWLAVTARLPAGIGPQQAAEAATNAARPLTGTTRVLTLIEGRRGRGEPVQALASPARLFSAAALLLLFIVWANVAGLFLARAAGRQRETATRLALGASRGRLAALVLTESFLIAVLGGALGLVWANALGQLLGRTLPSAPPAPPIDVRTFVFAWLLMLTTTVFVALVPGLLAARGGIPASLKTRDVSMSGWRNVSWRQLLVIAQLGLSLVALVAAGLCFRSGARLDGVDTGIDDRDVVLATFDASAAGYPQTRGLLFYGALQERAAALPGIANASLTHIVPFEMRSDSRTLGVPGYVPMPGEDMNVSQNWVGPDYFATLGVPLLRGREFRSTDRAGSAAVAVVNEMLARRFWPGQDPVGKRVSYAGPGDLEVIGLVKDHRARTPAEAARPMIYLPYQQRYQAVLTLVVRADGEAAGQVAAIRDAARSLDPAVAPYNIRTLAAEKGRSLAGARRTTEISSVFGLLCLIVSAVGLYGVLAQAVALRTREIAIRMALGAARTRTMRLVLGDAMMLVGLALVPGLAGAVAAGRLLNNMLYESEMLDLPTLAAAMALLCVVALAAAWRPAHRAAHVDPMVALRAE